MINVVPPRPAFSLYSSGISCGKGGLTQAMGTLYLTAGHRQHLIEIDWSQYAREHVIETSLAVVTAGWIDTATYHI